VLWALIVVGCGEKKGTYARFDDDVTAKSWEAWRDASRQSVYLGSTGGLPMYSHSGLRTVGPPGGACTGPIPTVEIAGSTLRASVASSTAGWRLALPRRPLAMKRYRSPSALWRELEARALVSRVKVERALRTGVSRAKPDWVKEFERSCPRGGD
jgi:hypothetical protein